MLFCSFVFFICGPNLCFNLVIQHRHLRGLNEQELDIEGEDGLAKGMHAFYPSLLFSSRSKIYLHRAVIASPPLITGILKGPELRSETRNRVLSSWVQLHQVVLLQP